MSRPPATPPALLRLEHELLLTAQRMFKARKKFLGLCDRGMCFAKRLDPGCLCAAHIGKHREHSRKSAAKKKRGAR